MVAVSLIRTGNDSGIMKLRLLTRDRRPYFKARRSKQEVAIYFPTPKTSSMACMTGRLKFFS